MNGKAPSFCATVNCIDGRVHLPVKNRQLEQLNMSVKLLKTQYPGVEIITLWLDEN